MRLGAGRGLLARLSVRSKLLLLIGGPGLVLLGFAIGFHGGILAPPDPRATLARGQRLADWFDERLADAEALTQAYLARPTEAPRLPGVPPDLVERLEGVGILDGNLNYLSWYGTPPEPWAGQTAAGFPAYQVRLDGAHTRLLVKAGPDDDERIALSSFIVDSRLPSYAFADLIPTALTSRVSLAVEFLDTEAWAGAVPESLERSESAVEDEGPWTVPFEAPDGTLLAVATIGSAPRGRVLTRLRNLATAWALLTLLAVVALVFDWPRLTTRLPGLGAAAVAIILGRVGLAEARAVAAVLPRDMGAAGLFGTSSAWRLASSPGELLLTGIALYLLAVALRRYLVAGVQRRATAVPLAIGAAAIVSAIAGWITVSLARNSAAPLLDAPGFWRWDGRLLLAVALVLVLLAGAELLALAWQRARATTTGPPRRPSRVVVGVSFLLLALAASLWLQRMTEDLALERLRSEYLPRVRNQEGRRRAALSATLGNIQRAFAEGDERQLPRSSHPDFLAYHFWITGELFFSGYRSSLDFYNGSGDLISHFGFDLPPLDEAVDPLASHAAEPEIREEMFQPVAAVQQRLLHAEIPVHRDGQLVGLAVAHVLDEPDNLAFLPGNRPYLAALGPGAPHASREFERAAPQYVLYDTPGTVLLSTLVQPPAMADVLVRAFERDGSLEFEAGEERYAGLAFQGEFHLLHLLALSSPTLLDRLAAALRLCLLGVGLLVAWSLLPRLLGPGQLARLTRGLRGSFYRKLLAALLLASMVPLVGLALFLRGYVQSRGEIALVNSATQFATAAQRVLNDYAATQPGADGEAVPPLNDEIVYWLRTVIGQEIHVYDNGLLRATSKRELFTAGLLAPRLDGEVQRRLGREGSPYLVLPSRLGAGSLPVAYAPLQSRDPLRGLVVAVPIGGQQQAIARSVRRVAEMILLSTVLLGLLLAVVAAYVARTVARPVRELVGATGRIAAGNYETRLEPRTQDEVAELVRGFNSMAGSLAAQRADLERRRDYMERLLLHATTGVISTDVDGRIVTLNPAARELLAVGDDRPRVGDMLAGALSRVPALRPLADRMQRPPVEPGEPADIDLELDGEPHRLRLVRVDLPDPSGGRLGQLILLDDVTDLMKSNQLAAWAEMARAIAHEIKNPLTPIQLSTEHLQRLLRDRGLLPADDLDACLETVKKQVRNLYEIAGEFSAYAKLPALAPQPADPVEFMREAAGPYRVGGPPGIEIEERYEAAGPVAIDAKVLRRAVVNLIENALQAMPNGGRLTLSVASDDGGNAVVLGVADTGTGLDPEVRRRLFEPYFSTKSSGTGLGLAIVRRAVEAHQGTIEVDSREGDGTEFRIRLPRSATGRAAPGN